MRQLKKFIGVDNLSLHYMRNILVSALAEQQIEAVTLSGILGHKDINTINKYLSTNHYKSSQIGLNKVDDILDVEVL
jgi:site-specific recombinase XerD